MGIPGNQAVAYGDNITYVLIDVKFSEVDNAANKKLIVAKALLEKVISFCNIEKFNIIKEFKGSILKGVIAQHPLNKKGYEQNTPLLNGEFVDDSEGTGFVHVAPS